MEYRELPVVTELKKTAEKAMGKRNLPRAMAAIAVAAEILYRYNQIYWDLRLEEMTVTLSETYLQSPPPPEEQESTPRRVLFYDGFGFDGRGLVLVFLKALVKAGFQVTYVTVGHARGNQPRLDGVLKNTGARKIYLDTGRERKATLLALDHAFREVRPQVAFFYTLPYDVPGAMVFHRWQGTCRRYQIDLTDHAYWLGKCAFDRCLSLRSLGASIAVHYREISREDIRMLPYYAPIDKTIPFEGFPFPEEDGPVIFSGGALYKTLGDPQLEYYKMVHSLLEDHPDARFLYAGTGDDSQLKVLEGAFPGRVFHIPERKDLYQVLRHCTLYLNTYPMFGGMMMNYAALAGRPPLTLKHDHDADGLLFDQDKLGVEFDTPQELLKEAHRLLTDPDYRARREQELQGCVITEERFTAQLARLVEEDATEFAVDTPFVDTTRFRQEYLERFDAAKETTLPFGDRINLCLLRQYPLRWVQGYWRRKRGQE